MKHLADKEIFHILNDLVIKNFTINNDGTVDVDRSVVISYRGLTEIPVQFGHVTGDFRCGVNKLTTLEGCPKYVDGNFFCSDNNLTSLVGSPKHVGANFGCNNNKLTSLVGGPIEVGGNFSCWGNPLPQEIYDNIKDIKYILQYQDVYNIWKGDGSLDKFRFQEMMKDIDI